MDQSSECEYNNNVDDDESIPTVVVKSDSDEECNECNCIIEDLLVKPFEGRDYHDKFSIITNGRPMPSLAPLTSKTRACTRRFNTVTYETHNWLCGCEKNLKLFCWACILFSDEVNQWRCTGVSDLNNLHNLLRRHEVTVSHISAMLTLKNFGRELNESFKIDTTKYNQLVKKNRHVVTKLIDVTCLLAELELPLKSDYEVTLRKSNFIEFINLLRRYDDNLDTHISNSNAFTNFSGDLQNDLIDSIYQVLVDEIKKVVAEAEFVALTLIETPDIENKCQIATVLRFSDKDGDVHERFLGFTELPHNTLLDPHILNMINDLKISSRLVSVSYNGPSFVSPKNRHLTQKIRYQHPGIYFVHHYSYKVFFNVKNMVNHIGQCKIFFWTLSGLALFFSKSSQRSFALYQEIRKRIPTHCSIKWDLNSNLVKSVIAYKIDIINLLDSMVENETRWDMVTFNEAKGFCSALENFEFNFQLHLFGDIFPQAEVLFEIFQEKSFDAECYLRGLEIFKKHLDKLKNNYNHFWLQLNKNYVIYEPGISKRIKIEDKKENYFKIYLEIIDSIQNKINYDKFNEMEHLNFTNLLDTQRFQEYSELFPNRSLFYLKKSVYGRLFDTNRLKTELAVVYKDPTFWKTDVYELYKCLCTNKLNEIIPEVYRLANLVITLPLAPASSDLTFSAPKRIQTYKENSRADDIPSSLALLSIEKTLLSELKIKPSFHDKVINRFGTKIRHIELSYR